MREPVAVLRLPAVAIMVAWQAGALAPSSAQEVTAGNLQEVIRSAAEEVLKVTENQPVSVGQITPTGLPEANGGPAIGELLKRQLELLQPGVVRRGAPFEIKGDYNLAPHPVQAEAKLAQKVPRLVFRIVDTSSGEEKCRLTRFVLDNTSIARVLGISGPLPLDPVKSHDQQAERRERNVQIQQLARNPQTFLHGPGQTLISSTKDSPYAIEILARPLKGRETLAAMPRQAHLERGLAYVQIERGELYEIRIHNDSTQEVAARLFVDGLDVFHFSDDRDPKTGQPRFAFFIVPPRSTETIVGWHKSVAGKEFLSFLVTAYGQGAASQAGLAAEGPIGVIEAQFSHCYPLPRGTRRRSPGNETGFGPPRRVDQEPVFREIDPPIDTVSVRYTR